jgi:glucuronate isomerase
MKPFLDDNFLLSNKVSEELYHDHAAKMPIIDYHNHLSPKEIAENRQFGNITEAWLEGDHYKWRALRANGVNEKYITGSASDEKKFEKWAETVPFTLRNPLYHWTHLELKRYFGITDLLSPSTSKQIYTKTKDQLQESSHSCNGLLKQMNVEVLCTTDDPIDHLKYHQDIAANNPGFSVLPTFRPDKALSVENPEVYKEYLGRLASISGINITSLDTLLEALENRIEYFHKLGCRLSDISFTSLPIVNKNLTGLEDNFKSVLDGKTLDDVKVNDLQAYILVELSKLYHKYGWSQQFHLGVFRNNNDRAMRELGPDTGFDSIGDASQGLALSKFFNHLDNSDQLAKTIVYNLNPRDNDLFSTMLGNFNDGKSIGKMQFGSGWWFMDQKFGMESQMNSLSSMGLLSRFVGMLTDSRSFLSFPRHEYFRRILCNLIGTDVVNGELPNDTELLGQLVENICYNNAKRYFNF